MSEERSDSGDGSVSIDSLPESVDSPNRSSSMDKSSAASSPNGSGISENRDATKSNESEPNHETGVGLSEEGEENSLFTTNPFAQGMEIREKRFRLLLLAGIFPLPVLGWIIGTIYSFTYVQTKRIHKKLQLLLVFLSSLGIIMTFVTLAIIFAEIKAGEDLTTKSGTIRGININPNAYVPPEELPPPTTHSTRYNDYDIEYIEHKSFGAATGKMLILFSDLDNSWKEHFLFRFPPNFRVHTYAVNAKDLRTRKRTSLDVLKDITKAFLLDSKKDVSIVTEFNIKEYERFNEYFNEHRGFKHLFAINPEVECKGREGDKTGASTRSSIINFLGLTQVDINCGGKSVKMPIQVTEDGLNRYEKRGPELADLVKYFFKVSFPKENRCYRRKNSRDLTKKYLDFVEMPLRKFLAYTDIEALNKKPINRQILCNKAL